MKAGVFDSGIGGLTVLASVLEYDLFEEIIYYGDTARVPYGTKNPQTIIKYANEALDFFEKANVDVLIFACNSVSAYAIDLIQSQTSLKVFGVIESGVMALEKITNLNDNILIIGTKATISSNKYQKNLQNIGYKNIQSIATPLFVPLIEEGILNSKILDYTMEHYFKDLKKPDAIILGCTHYPFISEQISRFFDNAPTIHSGEAIAEHLQKELKLNKNPTKSVSFFASDDISGLKEVTLKWINRKHHNILTFLQGK